MARRGGFVRTMAKAQHEAERRKQQQAASLLKAQSQAAKAAEQARKAYERASQAEQKEKTRLYIESRVAHANLQNEELEQTMLSLARLLTDAVAVQHFLNVQTLKQPLPNPVFNPRPLAIAEPPPAPQHYQPPMPTGLQKLLPGAKEKYAQEVAKAQESYRIHAALHAAREQERLRRLAEAQAAFEQHVLREYQQAREQYTEIDAFQRDLDARSPAAIVNYFSLILGASMYPDDFPQHAKVAYVPESKQLVVEFDLPPFDVIPEMSGFKYVKTKDEIASISRPLAQRKSLYATLVAQVTLPLLTPV